MWPISKYHGFRSFKAVFFVLLLCSFLLPSPASASSVTLNSTGFELTLCSDEERFPTESGENEIGVFTIPIPPDTFPAPGDPGAFFATEVSITFSVGDGDTAPGEVDEDDLVLTLGIPNMSNLITLPLALNGFPGHQLATVTNSLDLTTDPRTGQALATFLSESEGFLTFFITDLDQGGNFLDFREVCTEDFSLSVTLEELEPVPPPEGRHSLTARVFIDYRCNRFYKRGLDKPLANVPVTLSFANGATVTRRTGSLGLVRFSGFDPSDGVIVSVDLPESYRGYYLTSCINSPEIIVLHLDDFSTWCRHKFVQFGAERCY